VARETTVFARTSPEHKLRLVEALQAQGFVVAMTGDGVNDAPALKRADIGIAMGGRGTEAAKEVAAMVLADDNFASIAAAVREGRTVYDNLMKVVAWTLPTNGAEALAVIGAILFGLTLPLSPVQILWVNLLTAGALGITLAFEPPEPGTMRRPPRRPDAPILSGLLLWRIAFVSLVAAAAVFGLFLSALDRGLPLEAARTIAVNALVAIEIGYLFSVRYVHGSSLTWTGVLGTPAVLLGVGIVVLAQLAFTYVPFMQVVFATRPVGLVDGLAILGAALAFLLLVEAEKYLRARLGAKAMAG
jgi:magnesium-transporting ATPase (P-type)